MPIKYLIDNSLFSGSENRLRTALGGYFNPPNELVVGETPLNYFFEVGEGSSHDGIGVENLNSTDYSAATPLSERLSYVLTRTGDTFGESSPVQTTLSKDSIMINKKFPVRLIGDPENVFSDTHWEKIIVGGMWGKEQIQGIIKEGIVYDDQHTESIFPIDAKIRKRLAQINYNSPAGLNKMFSVRGDFVDIKPEINHYIPFYQTHTDNIQSELLIPNAYLMTSIELFGDAMALPITPYRYSEYNQNYC